MAFLFQRLCTHTPVLKKFKFSISILVLMLVFGAGCEHPNQEKAQIVHSADSLLSVVSDTHKRLGPLHSDSIALLLSRLEKHRKSGQWDNNPAALSSIASASKFLNELPPFIEALDAQFLGQEADLKQIKEFIEQQKLKPAEAKTSLSTQLSAYKTMYDQFDYFSSRYHAQLLLAQTLDKALEQ